MIEKPKKRDVHRDAREMFDLQIGKYYVYVNMYTKVVCLFTMICSTSRVYAAQLSHRGVPLAVKRPQHKALVEYSLNNGFGSWESFKNLS